MNKMRVICFGLLMAMCLVFIPSCDQATENANITAGSTIAVELALDAWAAKGDAAQAKLACALITTNAQAALDWLNGNPTPVGTDVVNLLNTTLTKGLDPIIAEAITLASGVLDAFMPTVPTSAMNSSQVGYIKAFLQGCLNGANGSSAKSLKRGIWMNGPTVQFQK